MVIQQGRNERGTEIVLFLQACSHGFFQQGRKKRKPLGVLNVCTSRGTSD